MGIQRCDNVGELGKVEIESSGSILYQLQRYDTKVCQEISSRNDLQHSRPVTEQVLSGSSGDK